MCILMHSATHFDINPINEEMKQCVGGVRVYVNPLSGTNNLDFGHLVFNKLESLYLLL